MTEKSRGLLDAVLELGIAERAWLAREVVASLDGAEPSEEVSAAWTDEIRRRVSEIEGGEVELEDWAASRERLLAQTSE